MKTKFPLFPGLSAPLVFGPFKGKFIYLGVGGLLAGLLTAMVVMAVAGAIPGILSAGVLSGGSLVYTALAQRKGMKKRPKGIFAIRP